MRKIFNSKIVLLSTKIGGRKSPISSGYRSLLRFRNLDIDFGFELTLQSGISLAPGSTGSATISIWGTDDLPSIEPGLGFEIREGSVVVGHGEVLAQTPS